MNKSETITLISKALIQAQSEMGNALKDSRNPFFKSTFATLNAVREACIPVLNKHGIGVFQPTTVIDNKLYLETMLLHESGEFITGLYEVVVGKVNDPQASGAALSYARRYALQAMVNIGADDDDGESAMGRNTKAPYVASTPTKTFVPPVNVKAEIEAAEKPKGGFGVKKEAAKITPKVETSTESEGWE